MKIDAGSIFTMAAMSLLTGNVVCTEPTEMEEVVKRAKEMRNIFKSKGHEVVMCIKALLPDFSEEKWPFCTSKNDFELAQYDFTNNRKYQEENAEMDYEAFKKLLEDPDIESKYRLSKVKNSVIKTDVLPF
jgi:hypothetical protein